jgi:hypothetical protein
MKKLIMLFSLIILVSQFTYSQTKIIIQKGPAATDTSMFDAQYIDSVTFRPTMGDLLYDDFDAKDPIKDSGWVYTNKSGVNSKVKNMNGFLTIDTLVNGDKGEVIIITKDLSEEISAAKENFLFEANILCKIFTDNKNVGGIEFGLMDKDNQFVFKFRIERNGNNRFSCGLYYSDESLLSAPYGDVSNLVDGKFTCTKTGNIYTSQFNNGNTKTSNQFYDRIINKCYIKFFWSAIFDYFPYGNPYVNMDFIRVKKLP